MEDKEYNPLNDLDECTAKFQPYIIDVSKDVKAPPYLFSIDGTGFSPVGDIQAIKAKAKNGKSQFTKILMAAALSGECLGVKCEIQDATVLYVDTEQAEFSSVKVMQHVLQLCAQKDCSGWKYNRPSPRFNGLNLRTVSTEYRWECVRDAIEVYKPTLVIIDGVRDLIRDFNNLEEGSYVVEKLMQTSAEYNCCIWSIIHENKNDDNMRGHMGTEYTNKSSDVFGVKKVVNNFGITFEVEQTHARNKDVNKLVFAVDDYGLPCSTDAGIGTEGKKELDKVMKASFDLMEVAREKERGEDGRTTYKFIKSNLVENVMKVTDLKKTRAYELIDNAQKNGIICQVGNLFNYCGIMPPKPDDEVPF